MGVAGTRFAAWSGEGEASRPFWLAACYRRRGVAARPGSRERLVPLVMELGTSGITTTDAAGVASSVTLLCLRSRLYAPCSVTRDTNKAIVAEIACAVKDLTGGRWIYF